jgi:hypothetical protein
MADPLRGVDVHIGNQTRTLLFNMLAFRIAKKALGGQSIREAIKDLDPPTVIELAAAGFIGAGDKRVTSDRVSVWLENEPEQYVPLANAVGQAIAFAYERMTPKDMTDDAATAEATPGKQ